MFAPAKIFKELNGFDENFYMYCEDVDFSLRSVQKQIFLGVCHESILWHRVSYSLRSKFNYKKNMAFGYVNTEKNLNGRDIEIEVEKTKYKAIIEIKPLHDPDNRITKN